MCVGRVSGRSLARRTKQMRVVNHGVYGNGVNIMKKQIKEPDSDSYGEAAALTELLGETPRVKIIAVLLKEGRDISVSQIAERGGMSRSSVYRHIDPLITIGVVEQTREIGGSPLYQIDKQSPVAQKLAELEFELVDILAGESAEEDDEFEIPDAPV